MKKIDPMNVELLDPNKVPWKLMSPVTSTDVFEGQTTNLHEEGLYSTSIFGRLGTQERDVTESYIDVKLPVFNPIYFNALVSLKGLYKGILSGKVYAEWDEVEKDFIKSNIIDGETGYSFFMKHYGKMQPKKNKSFLRDQRIAIFNDNKDVVLSNKVLVIPAGLRDIDFTPNGVPVEQEVNDLYRKLIFRSRSVLVNDSDLNDPVYDNNRWGIQDAYNTISEFFFSRIDGKTGIIRRKTSRRSIFMATRNVISSRKVSIENSQDNRTNDINSTIVGLYQALHAFNLVAIHALKNGFLADVFTPGIDMAKLVDKRTKRSVYVEVNGGIVDKFTSPDGLNTLFNGFANPNLRNRIIMVGGSYLGLVFDDGKEVCLLHDIDDLPPGRDKRFVRPMTYMDLFYTETCKDIESKMAQLTRYPITGIGSIYPSRVILKPLTTGAGYRKHIDLSGEVIGEFTYFPSYSEKPIYYDGMSVHNSRLSLLGGDFDGDAMSFNSIIGEDSIAEIEALFGRRDFYIGSANELLYEPVQDPHRFLLRALTSGIKKK